MMADTAPTFNNVLDEHDLKNRLTASFQSLIDILIHHCGPFASDCVIGSKYRQMNDVDEFTKDGIKILRHMVVTEDPIDRFATRMARFVGIAVDNRCHDGTTTSMELFCLLALIAIHPMDSSIFDRDRRQWVKMLKQELQGCLTHLKTLRITEDDLLARAQELGIETTGPDIRGAIAYHMAMISSKGDEDLSSKVSEIIRSSPSKIYGMFRDAPLAIETEEPYLLTKQTFDLDIKGNLGHAKDFNYKNNTQYKVSNAVIFLTGDELVKGGHDTAFLNAFLSDQPRYRQELKHTFGTDKGWEELCEGTRSLIIMAPMIDDIELQTNVNVFNMEYPNARVSLFRIQVSDMMRRSLNKTLHYVAGKPLFEDVMMKDPTECLIGLDEGRGVDAHLIGHVMQLSNLYVKDDDVFHPFYRDETLFPAYNQFCRETEELLMDATSNITNPGLDQYALGELTSLYKALTCQNIVNIEVGGSIHDQYANRTVYEDAIGAALSAVNEGMILGGYGHLYQYLDQRFTASSDSTPEGLLLSHLKKAMGAILQDSLRLVGSEPEVINILKDLFLDVPDKWYYGVADLDDYHTNRSYLHKRNLDAIGMRAFLDKNRSETILIQAYAGFEEQFRRFRDILPRLAGTTHLIDMRMRPEEAHNAS